MESGRVRVAGKYLILKKLGSGSFGDVYLGKNTESQEDVAIKVEDTRANHQQLLSEAKILTILSGQGIPKIYWYGTEGLYNIMVLELLGPSLEDLFNKHLRKFSTKSIIMIADHLFQRIELMHTQNYLHRDVKPDNFLCGLGKNSNLIYVIDFGLSKKYRDNATKLHIKFSDKRSLTGTARYASINSHMGSELSRRDDLEGIVYVLIYLFAGVLPWQGITCKNKTEKNRIIADIKINTSIEIICRGTTPEICNILKYSRGLRFEETPDYEYIKTQLKIVADREMFEFDYLFDWNVEVEKKRKKKGKTSKKKSKKPKNSKSIKEDDLGTCLATSRWPEFSDKEMVFSKILEEKGDIFGIKLGPPTPPRSCTLF